MRIWHEQLIPKLCQKHLCAMWREGLGAYKIITENKKGYSNHPAVKEFEKSPLILYYRLQQVRSEMLLRGYNPKDMPLLEGAGKNPLYIFLVPRYHRQFMTEFKNVREWQTLDEQVQVLKSKQCKCAV